MIVVDNSVAVKWVVSEDGSDTATTLYGEDLVAPDLLAIEFANVLRTKIAKGEFDQPQMVEALRFLGLAIPRFEPSRPLVSRALEIAVELSHSVYDCVYLALAEREEATLVTADKKLIARVHGTSFSAMVRAL